MPRIGRLHIPGGYYHVIGRGLERRFIFSSNADKQDFLDRLAKGLAKTRVQCLAWALMGNHYHLLLQVGDKPLKELMQPLLGGYASAYNRRHNRIGYVFQNRYHSILCDESAYLLELIRYIHLNPVRAEIVRDLPALDHYRWTGHHVLIGAHDNHWQSVDSVLLQFGQDWDQAISAYREFIAHGIDNPPHRDLDGGGLVRSAGGWQSLVHLRKEHEKRIGDERILGDSEFVQRTLQQDQLGTTEPDETLCANWELHQLVMAVCAYFLVDIDDIAKKTRLKPLSTAKSVICYLGARKIRISSTEIGRTLNLSQSGVSKSASRGSDYCRRQKVTLETLARYRR